MGLIKREYTDLETVISAENLNAIQDAVIALEDGLFSVDNNKSGEVVTITDAANRGFRSIRVFGKTTQNGTPTPDAPVELVNIGSSGSITVSVTGEDVKSMTIATPNGLPGIPVTSGGNYTDANGQQWICDEIDFGRGVYVQRCYAESVKMKLDETNTRYTGSTSKNANAKVASGIGIFVLSDTLPYDENAGKAGAPVNGVRISIEKTRTVVAYYNGEVISSVNVLYPLETPIETPLSAEELVAFSALHTYRGNTVVSNDAGAYMDLEYVMDAKKYIDSLITGGVVPATVE